MRALWSTWTRGFVCAVYRALGFSFTLLPLTCGVPPQVPAGSDRAADSARIYFPTNRRSFDVGSVERLGLPFALVDRERFMPPRSRHLDSRVGYLRAGHHPFGDSSPLSFFFSPPSWSERVARLSKCSPVPLRIGTCSRAPFCCPLSRLLIWLPVHFSPIRRLGPFTLRLAPPSLSPTKARPFLDTTPDPVSPLWFLWPTGRVVSALEGVPLSLMLINLTFENGAAFLQI